LKFDLNFVDFHALFGFSAKIFLDFNNRFLSLLSLAYAFILAQFLSSDRITNKNL